MLCLVFRFASSAMKHAAAGIYSWSVGLSTLLLIGMRCVLDSMCPLIRVEVV